MLTPSQRPQHFWPMFVLVGEFWLSGLWILSLIFTVTDAQQLEHINLWMFVTLGVGSLVGGYASDILSRERVFHIGSGVWAAGAGLALVSSQVGYIVTAGAIGLLNNLTFVIIMEHFPQHKDRYTIYVLMGWAMSQVTLGMLFYLMTDLGHFFMLLFVITLLYFIAACLFIESPYKQQSQNLQSRAGQAEQQRAPLLQRLLPGNYKVLLSGCVLMFVMQMFYYRTQFTLDRFGISLQLNTIVVGCTQLVANVAFTQFINRLPRKLYLRLFLVVLACLFFVLVIVHNKIVQTLVEGVMRLFDTCIMIVLGVYLPEMFAQGDRGKGTNYVMSFGVLGSALNGIILNAFRFWQLIFFLLVGFLATFFFTETNKSKHEQQQHFQQAISD